MDTLLEMDKKMIPAIWKISHGTQKTGLSDENKKIFRKRNVVVVHSKTLAKASSKISQGEDFKENIRKGDYFYLCYGNRIQLLGQFTEDTPRENPEIQDGWLERSYRVIAQSKETKPYTGTQKWWTPNDNSTCIEVVEADKTLFEQLILKPYFHLSLDSLMETVQSVTAYTKEDFLQTVFMTEKRLNLLIDLLRNKKNLILQGAPGVGKTFTAKKLAYVMMGEKDDSRMELVQFHPNYSYEDFVMGYRPNGAEFKLTEGIFYRFCQKAANYPDKEYFFLIDEINRGNLSKIFGELMMLIEKDYRGTKATLAYNGLSFTIPSNIYIIGMMNTADRSLAMMDYALRRRFSFFAMEPGFSTDGFQAYQQELENETFDALIREIQALNKEIASDASLGCGFQIGHSYFCGCDKTTCTNDWMHSVVEFDVLPTLSEYWFDEPEKLQQWEKKLRGVFDDE